MNIIEKELDDSVAVYCFNELADGGALSAALRVTLVSRKSGRWSVLLPEEPRGDVLDFRAGGKFPTGAIRPVSGGYSVDVLNANESLGTILCSLSGIGTFAFEAVNSRADDAERPRFVNSRLAILEETVVILRDAAASTPRDLVNCLQLASSSWYRVAVASTSRDGDWLRDRQQWTAEDARVFAEGAQCVALGVYDGESYLLWRAE